MGNSTGGGLADGWLNCAALVPRRARFGVLTAREVGRGWSMRDRGNGDAKIAYQRSALA